MLVRRPREEALMRRPGASLIEKPTSPPLFLTRVKDIRARAPATGG
jgi:hypothetical protein